MKSPASRGSTTLKALEERRLRAAKRFEQGWSASRVARECGVTPQAAALWRKRWQEGGTEALRSTGRRGRKPSLSGEQLRQLEEALLRGPKAQGYATDLWTLARIAKLIRQLFGITFSITHVWRLLRQMGWSSQKPARRAKERDEERIEDWRHRVWPRVKRGLGAKERRSFS